MRSFLRNIYWIVMTHHGNLHSTMKNVSLSFLCYWHIFHCFHNSWHSYSSNRKCPFHLTADLLRDQVYSFYGTAFAWSFPCNMSRVIYTLLSYCNLPCTQWFLSLSNPESICDPVITEGAIWFYICSYKPLSELWALDFKKRK